MTSSGIPKPAFYTYQLLKNISGDLLYREKNYFVVKDDRTSSTVYTIVVMNYNDEIEHLYTAAQMCIRPMKPSMLSWMN